MFCFFIHSNSHILTFLNAFKLSSTRWLSREVAGAGCAATESGVMCTGNGNGTQRVARQYKAENRKEQTHETHTN